MKKIWTILTTPIYWGIFRQTPYAWGFDIDYDGGETLYYINCGPFFICLWSPLF